MSHWKDDSPEFARLLSGDGRADLVRIALEIARDAFPELDSEPYLRRIEDLADRIRPRADPFTPTLVRLQQINWVLYVEEEFSGNDEDYFDPRNSYLNEVIDRRKGIPISLGVLFWGVADRLGLAVEGVNLPAHFVLRADCEDGSSIFIDPFHGGRLLNREGCRRLVASRAGPKVELTDEQFQPVSTAAVVCRMLRNLRGIYLQSGDASAAYPVLRRLSALEPAEASHRRDLGLVALGLDRLEEAIAQLSAYLEQGGQPSDAATVRALILDARRRRDEPEPDDGPG